MAQARKLLVEVAGAFGWTAVVEVDQLPKPAL